MWGLPDVYRMGPSAPQILDPTVDPLQMLDPTVGVQCLVRLTQNKHDTSMMKLDLRLLHALLVHFELMGTDVLITSEAQHYTSN